jgi:hypothetical protein
MLHYSKYMAHKIVSPLKSDELMKATSKTVLVCKVAAVIKHHRLVLSICQSAEWGMGLGALQSMCGLLQCNLPSHSVELKLMLDL